MTTQTDPAAHPDPSLAKTVTSLWRSWGFGLGGVLAILALGVSVSLWQKLAHIQEQLALQSANTAQQSLEAKAWAKQAQEIVKDSAARLALLESRVGEVALQRGQLDELMQSLSRTRDENLVVDIESALRMAQQQAQLTGNMEPLLEVLKSAELRLKRSAQPRLMPVIRAIEKDMERLKSTQVFDLPGMLAKLDEGVLLVDSLLMANQKLPSAASNPKGADASAPQAQASWWVLGFKQIGDQFKDLVRVSRIESPEAALLSPDQKFFLQENLKLKLLNARLGLLARQQDGARADLASAAVLVRRYAEPSSRKTTQLLELLEQATVQMKLGGVPRVDGSLTALATAAAGR